MSNNFFPDTDSFSLSNLSPGRLATLACLLEVSAPKPGNVHRRADFEDVTFDDFMVSAIVLGNIIDAFEGRLGAMIYDAVSQTLAAVGTNTNLGLILLLCPLAKALRDQMSLSRDRVRKQIENLNAEDSSAIYAAIRLAAPGGLQNPTPLDIVGEAPDNLIDAMALAADRDLIARQFVNGFEQVFEDCLAHLIQGQERFVELRHAIVFAHVKLMSVYPDSLIFRKNGGAVARESQLRAQQAIDGLERGDDSFWTAVSDLDSWLRSDGNRRNPGTTADLIGAGIFVGICNGRLHTY